jgi:hypothetical protein
VLAAVLAAFAAVLAAVLAAFFAVLAAVLVAVPGSQASPKPATTKSAERAIVFFIEIFFSCLLKDNIDLFQFLARRNTDVAHSYLFLDNGQYKYLNYHSQSQIGKNRDFLRHFSKKMKKMLFFYEIPNLFANIMIPHIEIIGRFDASDNNIWPHLSQQIQDITLRKAGGGFGPRWGWLR